jgi:hypothetical protein
MAQSAPPPQGWAPAPPPPITPPPKSRTALYVAGAVVVSVVLVALVLAASGAFSPKAPSSNNGPPPPPPAIVTVVTSGTVWNLNAGYYEDVGPIDLTSNSSWTISGSFTASNGITAYVMTSSEYSAWGGSGSPSAYYWTSGSSVTSGSVNTNLPSGTYYFVWDNTNSFTSTSVQITSDVIATASG